MSYSMLLKMHFKVHNAEIKIKLEKKISASVFDKNIFKLLIQNHFREAKRNRNVLVHVNVIDRIS